MTPADAEFREAGRRVVARFGDLEACFRGVTGTEPAAVRLARVQALSDAALGLTGALRRERPDVYAGFIGCAWRLDKEVTADAR
jgi:hypothetical protein